MRPLLLLSAIGIASISWNGPLTSPDNRKSVKIDVSDEETGESIPEYEYQYWINTADRKGDTAVEKWQTHRAAAGVLELHAPLSCEIKINVRAREYEGGPARTNHTLLVKSDNKERKFYIELRRGIVVSGVIRDARTKQPVKDAKIFPRIWFGFPFDSRDYDRTALSDDQGRFTLPGVDPFLGADVSHPEYFDGKIDTKARLGKDERKDIKDVELLLEPGETLQGRVTTTTGQPLAEVEVNGSRTDSKGFFVLRGQRIGGEVRFTKDGYLRKYVKFPAQKYKSADANVTLEPCYELRGYVRGPDGKLVRSFEVWAGPGQNPERYQCSHAKVDKGDNSFVLHLNAPGDHWIGVRAEGYAAWEGSTNIVRQMDDLTITLEPGVKVTGRAELPSGDLGPVSLTLVPRRPKNGEAIWVVGGPRWTDPATLNARLQNDGTFRFENVRPGEYLLTISGKGITEQVRALNVTDSGINGLAAKVERTGRLVGQVYWPFAEKGEWAFADGEIRSHSEFRFDREPIHFKADEHGRFQVDDVPATDIRVGFPYRATAHFIAHFGGCARIVPGQTTIVRYHVPGRKDNVFLDLMIGDGSKKQFATGTGRAATRQVGKEEIDRKLCYYVRLTPAEAKPTYFPEAGPHWIVDSLPPQVTLTDVAPGKYHLWMGDGQVHGDLSSELYRATIEVTSKQRAVRIPLGAGSVTGQIKGPADHFGYADVLAISENGKLRRLSRTDQDGSFCLRYLSEGRWILRAHDDKAGWCRIGEVVVNKDTQDVGVHQLKAGGAISVSIDLGKATQLPDAVLAINEDGFHIEARAYRNWDEDKFMISGLWPGSWTLKLTSGETVLATSKVKLEGTENVRAKLSCR